MTPRETRPDKVAGSHGDWFRSLSLSDDAITGCELADDFGTLRVLDAAEWQRRRERLQKLGGPPLLD